MKQRVAAVLFDLDGTLVDSAPDLAGTANDMLGARGRAPLPYAALRPHAGSGARGMIGAAFGIARGEPGFEALRDEFHDRYAARLLRETRPFDAALAAVRTLEKHGMPWGIVTNKALRFAEPLVAALVPGAAALVGGDSTPFTKPHPEPLREAARRLDVALPACVYVGDDERDMRAGRAAGMFTAAAAWGYLGPDAELAQWQADVRLDHPHALLQWLDLA